MELWVLLLGVVGYALLVDRVRLQRRLEEVDGELVVERKRADEAVQVSFDARDARLLKERQLEHAHEQIDDLRLHLARAEQAAHADSALQARGFQVIRLVRKSRTAWKEMN